MRPSPMLLGAAALVALWVASAQAGDPVPYSILDGAIPKALTDAPGNSARGRTIVRDIRNVTCLICHVLPIPDEPDQGALGPSLVGVGARYSVAELRLRLVDPKALNPDTIMPAYYRSTGHYQVAEKYRGQTIYTAQQIEDVVAYLASLTEAGQ